ncbi:hypothetical protein [Treponema sp.]|uniref:hypothetical protein n=1 Tax=Treponema sp. TaxID=166 RepID=UPI00389057D1
MNSNEMPYELRALTAKDIFPMLKIISKIGINDIKQCFEAESVMNAVKTNAKPAAVGLPVLMEVARVIIDHLPNCENEIFAFLANMSGMTKKDIADLPMGVFASMIVDLLKKEEFKDFFAAVAKLAD